MCIPSIFLLWHGFSAYLGSYGERQWTETSALAASYAVDLTLAGRRGPLVMDEDNFMAQPYMKSLIFEKEGPAATDLVRLKSLLTPGLPTVTEELESGQAVDFESLAARIDLEWPDLLEGAQPTESAASQVLRATEQSGIPWEELEKATTRPASQLPPIGSLPPEDDFTAPENSLRQAWGIIQLVQVGRLRIHAAMACGQPRQAMGVLKIQRRLGDAYAGRPSLMDAMGANHVTLQMLAGVKAGLRVEGWRPQDWTWLAGWAGTIDGKRLLTKAWGSEIYFGINSVRHTERFPEADDRQFNQLSGTLGRELMDGEWSESWLPFGQPFLRVLRGQAAILYRSAPPGAFLLWKADAVKRICQYQLRPLTSGGLFSYAWPDVPRQEESKVISEQRMGESFMISQSHLRLLIISQALRLWHQEHGDYPASLDSIQEKLAPDFCQDPFSSRPLCYQRLSPSGYRLYSVGADLTDDGGAPQTKENGDIPWHRPK